MPPVATQLTVDQHLQESQVLLQKVDLFLLVYVVISIKARQILLLLGTSRQTQILQLYLINSDRKQQKEITSKHGLVCSVVSSKYSNLGVNIHIWRG